MELLSRVWSALKGPLKWVVVAAAGAVLTLAIQQYDASRPKLRYDLTDTNQLIAPSGIELHRYDLTVWHGHSGPVTDMTLTLRGGTPPELRVRDRDMTGPWVQPVGGTLKLAGSLRLQEKLRLTLDAPRPLTPDDVLLTSNEIQGGRYVPLWREAVALFGALGLIQGILLSVLFTSALMWLVGGDRLFRMIRRTRDYAARGEEVTKRLGDATTRVQGTVLDLQAALEHLDKSAEARERTLNMLEEQVSRFQALEQTVKATERPTATLDSPEPRGGQTNGTTAPPASEQTGQHGPK